jgi:hypothetical protein
MRLDDVTSFSYCLQWALGYLPSCPQGNARNKLGLYRTLNGASSSVSISRTHSSLCGFKLAVQQIYQHHAAFVQPDLTVEIFIFH